MRMTKQALSTAILAGSALLLTAGIASAQVGVVSLTASQQTVVLPDGNTVPMWGWTCGGVTGNPVTTAATGATCTSLNYTTAGVLAAQTNSTTWQPPLIVVPYVAGGTSLTINLTNTLPVETSLMIIGQAGGGLGAPVREAGPRTDGAHAGQTATTWTIVANAANTFTPPTQGARARTLTSIEVAGVTTVGGTPAAAGVYSFPSLQPGTYLIRTGTYPSIQGPMGLYGVLVVTKLPVTGTPGLAYPVPLPTSTTGVTYDADVVALESEIDARQNNMVAALFPKVAGGPSQNAGFIETAKWTSQCGAAPNSLPNGHRTQCPRATHRPWTTTDVFSDQRPGLQQGQSGRLGSFGSGGWLHGERPGALRERRFPHAHSDRGRSEYVAGRGGRLRSSGRRASSDSDSCQNAVSEKPSTGGRGRRPEDPKRGVPSGR